MINTKQLVFSVLIIFMLLITAACEQLEKAYELGEMLANTINEISEGVDSFTGETTEKVDNPLKDILIEIDGFPDEIPVLDGHAVVSFLDIGQGDATLVQTTDTTILIDTGRHDNNRTLKLLEAKGIEKIDILILSHVHADHIGKSDKIIHTYKPTEVWLNGDMATSRTFERLLDAIQEQDSELVEPKRGETLQKGPFQFTILNPGAQLTGDANNDSLSFKMTYRNITFTFTGDAEKSAERAMVDSGMNLKTDVFKMGHHGSKTSNNDFFLEKLQPSLAVYSAGKGNRYGHPHQEALDRFKQTNTTVLGTDQNGTVTVITDGNSLEVKTEK